MLQSPGVTDSIPRVLAPSFAGSSLQHDDSKIIRPGSTVVVYLDMFPRGKTLTPEPFLKDLQAYLKSFTHIYTADFQVTEISGSPDSLHTRVRFELVGSGAHFHREQRLGFWDLEWRNYQLKKWTATEQTRSQSLAPCYFDTAPRAFSGAACFSAQLDYGVDYWRTILDGASGIDIYGHNGVSVGDIDNDGFDDIYVCQPAGLPNRLFRNRGDGTFEDITEISGLGLLDNTACALFADFNNDGRQDLVVVRAEGPLLFLNQGGGKFQLKPNAFHFATTPQGTFTGAAAADYNRDGHLDIYFCLYVFYRGAGQYNYPTPYYDAENGPPNFLMRNEGDGTFIDVTSETGLSLNNTRFSFCCAWGDINGDGWPDLYVVNDFGRKNLYRNNGDGTFTDIAPQAGVEDVGAGMSVSWFDYDNDGRQDLYVANMWTAAGQRIAMQPEFLKNSAQPVRALYRKHAMGNSLLQNLGTGRFEDRTEASAVRMGRWSWSSDAFDFDHSGRQSLYVTNGMLSGPIKEDLNSFFWRQVVANSPDDPKPQPAYEQGWSSINELIRADYTWSGYERNVLLANNGDGKFSDISGVSGLDFLEDGRAFSLADFNHDGRQEILLKNRCGPQLRLLQNVMPDLPASIVFTLTGAGRSNRDAIGAAVTIETNIGKQTKWLQAGSGFLSQHSKDIFFGLGDSKGNVSVSITWPSGVKQRYTDLPPNHRISLDESLQAPKKIESFRPVRALTAAEPRQAETLPVNVETWLLSPIAALEISKLNVTSRSPVLLYAGPGSHPTAMNIEGEALGVYNVIYRYLFDRHRDLSVPTAFLVDSKGEIVKIYQGDIQAANVERDMQELKQPKISRVRQALPFAGVEATFAYRRNYLTLGSAFFKSGYFAQAQTSFERALEDDPASAEAQYGIGSAYLKQEKIAEAQASFEAAVKMKASYPDTISDSWNNLGLLASRRGDIDAAAVYFKAALKDNPDYQIALLNLGNAYRQRKQWDEARQTLRHLLDLSPEDPEANYGLAMVFAQTDDANGAYEYLRRALKARPGYPEALNNLGILYLRTRRRDDAVRTFEECIRVSPDFNQSYLNLARVYVLEGNNVQARSLLLELLKRHPQDAQAQRALEQVP